MKIVLATGIFPPEIGGPATYVRGLARELTARGDDVIVITYGAKQGIDRSEGYWVVSVGKQGGFLRRWLRYREELAGYGAEADYVCAFTSISAGMPVLMSGLHAPMKILRLGGDFFWERYTDAGGELTLREWYASRFGFWRLLNTLVMAKVLRAFDLLVYSTEFQRDIHAHAYRRLPRTTVEHNARPEPTFTSHERHVPFRLLFMGRFVRFKNILSLIEAMNLLPDATLSIVGEGPIDAELRARVKRLGLEDRITFKASVAGAEKRATFDAHDLLVLPSLTEISPNTALEARAACLPVLLTKETGLAPIPDVHVKDIRTPARIAHEVRDIMKSYRSPRADDTVHTYGKISDALFPVRR